MYKRQAEDALNRANITVNKNAVPNDPRPPRVTSGLRIGTPAITTRGFKTAETAQLTDWIADVLDVLQVEQEVDTVVNRVRGEVLELCSRFPVYMQG